MADHVDMLLSQWQRERPDLDVAPMAVLGRLSRVTRMVESRLATSFAQFGLQGWSFDVLATLWCTGHPFEMNPSAIVNSLMVSNSAMTNRIDRLEQAGWVERRNAPTDRRVTLVRLTATGLDLVNKAVDAHLANGRQLLESLDDAEQELLATLLRKLAAGVAET
jgi:DNA-binding MarR family transcriptional regulator